MKARAGVTKRSKPKGMVRRFEMNPVYNASGNPWHPWAVRTPRPRYVIYLKCSKWGGGWRSGQPSSSGNAVLGPSLEDCGIMPEDSALPFLWGMRALAHYLRILESHLWTPDSHFQWEMRVLVFDSGTPGSHGMRCGSARSVTRFSCTVVTTFCRNAHLPHSQF